MDSDKYRPTGSMYLIVYIHIHFIFHYQNLGQLQIIKQIRSQTRVSFSTGVRHWSRIRRWKTLGQNRRWSTEMDGMNIQLFQLFWTAQVLTPVAFASSNGSHTPTLYISILWWFTGQSLPSLHLLSFTTSQRRKPVTGTRFDFTQIASRLMGTDFLMHCSFKGLGEKIWKSEEPVRSPPFLFWRLRDLVNLFYFFANASCVPGEVSKSITFQRHVSGRPEYSKWCPLPGLKPRWFYRCFSEGSYNFDTNLCNLMYMCNCTYIVSIYVHIILIRGKRKQQPSEDGSKFQIPWHWIMVMSLRCRILLPQSDSGRHARPGSRRRWLALKLPGITANKFRTGTSERSELPKAGKIYGTPKKPSFEGWYDLQVGQPQVPRPTTIFSRLTKLGNKSSPRSTLLGW